MGMTDRSHFEQLLLEAAKQPEKQRLLFVFARAGLPDHPSQQQSERFRSGEGGTLTPLMCVDKDPSELRDFEALSAEAARAGPPWQVVFAAGLAGAAGRPPTEAQIAPALEKMVHAIWSGSVGQFAAFDPTGASLTFG